jgi:hypothetical protein
MALTGEVVRDEHVKLEAVGSSAGIHEALVFRVT